VSTDRENIELKTRDPDPRATEAACRAIGAEDHGMLVQRDTYFGVAEGLLKLREDTDQGVGELIFYRRAREPRLRSSRYWRAGVDDPAALRALLEAAHGVTGVVEKRRRLFTYENVRIHLDDVRGLGTYVELESVLATPGAESGAEARALATVVRELGLAARPPIAGGYLELSRG
jgi:adenylate cyclase, class 2